MRMKRELIGGPLDGAMAMIDEDSTAIQFPHSGTYRKRKFVACVPSGEHAGRYTRTLMMHESLNHEQVGWQIRKSAMDTDGPD